MVSAIGNQYQTLPPLSPSKAAKIQPDNEDNLTLRKSAESIGQKAKTAIDASDAPDLSHNIRGKIASMMARHLEFAELLRPAPEGESKAPVTQAPE